MHRDPRGIKEEVTGKEALLRARAPEAAVWVLAQPEFVNDACCFLLGFVKLGCAARVTGATTDLRRRLQRHVLALSPAVAVVSCLCASIGQVEVRVVVCKSAL